VGQSLFVRPGRNGIGVQTRKLMETDEDKGNPTSGRSEVTFGRIVVNQNGSRTFTERFSKTEDVRTVPCPAPVMDAQWAPPGGGYRGGSPRHPVALQHRFASATGTRAFAEHRKKVFVHTAGAGPDVV